MVRSVKNVQHKMKAADRWLMVGACMSNGITVAQASRRYKVDRRTVKMWIDRYKSTGTVEDAQRSGRPALLDQEASRRAIEMLGSGMYGSATDVSKVLYQEGLTPHVFSRTGLVKAAKKEAKRMGLPALSYKRGRPKKKLSPLNKKKRLQFCKAHLHMNWSHVMFTDRKRFEFKYPGEQVKLGTWGFAGKKVEATTVNHPKGYNIYAGCTIFGVTKGKSVAGTCGQISSYRNKKGQQARGITNNEYADVMKLHLLPQGSKVFSTQGIATWTFQQDNDSSHSKAGQVLQMYNNVHNTCIQLLLDWPPNSPDLSPIENIWGIVDRKVASRGCKNFEDFKKAVDEELQNIPRLTLARLWKGMHDRMRKCIELEGGRISH